MVLGHDFLDVMAWDIAISAILLAVASLTLSYNSKEGRIDAQAQNTKLGYAVVVGVSGFYLFLSGLAISLVWPFKIASGVYNVLFGGIATLGGLTLIAGSIALSRDVNIKPVTYFSGVVGLYAIVNAYGIMRYSLTSSPLMSTLGYLSFAAPALLAVPATHLEDRRWRILFAIFALLFAAAWLIEAATFTIMHLKPS